jgi:hypothetical protein
MGVRDGRGLMMPDRPGNRDALSLPLRDGRGAGDPGDSQLGQRWGMSMFGAEGGRRNVKILGRSVHRNFGRVAMRAVAVGALSLGALATGALAVGALAIGALAVGRLAVGNLAVGRVRIKSLEIQDLSVARLHAADVSVSRTLELRGRDLVPQLP